MAFSTGLVSGVSEEDLMTRVKNTDMDSRFLKLLGNLTHSYIDGGEVARTNLDGDSYTFSIIRRSEYEKAVNVTLDGAPLDPEQRKLAEDLASYAFHEGFRLEGQNHDEFIQELHIKRTH